MIQVENSDDQYNYLSFKFFFIGPDSHNKLRESFILGCQEPKKRYILYELYLKKLMTCNNLPTIEFVVFSYLNNRN